MVEKGTLNVVLVIRIVRTNVRECFPKEPFTAVEIF